MFGEWIVISSPMTAGTWKELVARWPCLSLVSVDLTLLRFSQRTPSHNHHQTKSLRSGQGHKTAADVSFVPLKSGQSKQMPDPIGKVMIPYNELVLLQ